MCPDIAVSRYRVTNTRYRVIFPDIGPDIGNIGPDIGSISGHTRSLPNPISGFSPISCPMWSRYCKTISEYTDIGSKKPRYRSRCVFNIGIYRCRVFPISGCFLISGTIYHLLRQDRLLSGNCPGAPAGPASWSSALQTNGAVPWVLPTSLRTACYCRKRPGSQARMVPT